jgi:hypothetical protein
MMSHDQGHSDKARIPSGEAETVRAVNSPGHRTLGGLPRLSVSD